MNKHHPTHLMLFRWVDRVLRTPVGRHLGAFNGHTQGLERVSEPGRCDGISSVALEVGVQVDVLSKVGVSVEKYDIARVGSLRLAAFTQVLIVRTFEIIVAFLVRLSKEMLEDVSRYLCRNLGDICRLCHLSSQIRFI
jgi:hypothetical protein